MNITLDYSQIIVWLIVGALAGSIAGMLVKRTREGFGPFTNLGIGTPENGQHFMVGNPDHFRKIKVEIMYPGADTFPGQQGLDQANGKRRAKYGSKRHVY